MWLYRDHATTRTTALPERDYHRTQAALRHGAVGRQPKQHFRCSLRSPTGRLVPLPTLQEGKLRTRMKIGESSRQGLPLDFQSLLTSQSSAADDQRDQQSAPALRED